MRPPGPAIRNTAIGKWVRRHVLRQAHEIHVVRLYYADGEVVAQPFETIGGTSTAWVTFHNLRPGILVRATIDDEVEIPLPPIGYGALGPPMHCAVCGSEDMTCHPDEPHHHVCGSCGFVDYDPE